MTLSAFVHKVEANVSHIITVFEQDVATGKSKLLHEIPVLAGDSAGAFEKLKNDAVTEANAIEQNAAAAVKAIRDKLDAVKAALGL